MILKFWSATRSTYAFTECFGTKMATDCFSLRFPVGNCLNHSVQWIEEYPENMTVVGLR